MKALAVTHPGCEQLCAQELKERFEAKIENTQKGIVIFEVESIQDLAEICYVAQSVIRVVQLLDSFHFEKEEEIVEKSKTIDFASIINDKTFAVRVCRVEDEDILRSSIEEDVGYLIKGKVNLSNPDVLILVVVSDEQCFIGIDFAGRDLSKRDYRIFTGAGSIRATLGFCAFLAAEVEQKMVMIDPFCTDGTIPIEAALFFGGMSVNYYRKDRFAFRRMFPEEDWDTFLKSVDDKFSKSKVFIGAFAGLHKYIAQAKKNAKIAGVEKLIEFSRTEVEWLDTKFSEGELDVVVSCPPPFTQRNDKKMENLMKEFFYQLRFVIKKRIVILTTAPERIAVAAEKYEFTISKKLAVMQGKQDFVMMIIEKK